MAKYIGCFAAIVGIVTVIWRIVISFQAGEDRDAHTTIELDGVHKEEVDNTFARLGGWN